MGDQQPEGHGRIRRSIHSANGLLKSPHPDIATVYDVVQYSAKRYGSKRAMGYRKLIKEHVEEKTITKKVDGVDKKIPKKWTYFEYGDYEYISFLEVQKITHRLGSGLHALGMNPGDKLEIFAGTSMFWMLMAQAANTQSLPIVTAYDTLGIDGLHHSLAETGAKSIFTDALLLSQLQQALKDTTITTVIYKGEPKQADIDGLKKTFKDLRIMSYEELDALGEQNPHEAVPPKADDLCCIMYTSGSTGTPKGVIITHRNIVAAISGADKAINHYVNSSDYLMAFLPLAHILEFVFETTTLYWGGTLGYGTVKTLTDTNMRNCKGDLAEFRPTIMVGVPAVWEMVRKGIVTKILQAPFVAQKMFWGALYMKGFMYNFHLPGKSILDAVVFKKIKQATGGRLKLTLNGGAPLAKETQHFLSMALCPCLSGYGLTETCATAAIMSPEQWTAGAVGAPLACLDVKLVDVVDAGYLHTNNPPQGEVWLRGDSITSGYLNRDKENKEAFVDGWFLTGDIGQWDSNGLLSIIDRKKNLVKTRNGEYIAIEKLESQYRTCELAANVCVYADPEKTKPICLVVVNESALKKFAQQHNIAGTHQDAEDMCQDKKIQSAVHERMLEIGRAGGLKGIELVEAVILIDQEFTPQNGLVTSAQKLNRKKIQEKFQSQIDAAYAQSGSD